ncbi:MAG TPA: alpha-2-macroglobulin family protein [Candidatus Ozemobacteraceae bacterium]|nr:alpha-2-macroglobulin family protein [Candidatus Ozemobacteraceae bacterium]
MHTSRFPSSGFRTWLLIPFLTLLLAAVMAGTAHAAPLEVTWKLVQEGDLQPLDWRLTLDFSRPVSVLELSKKIKCLTASATTMFTVINATDTGAPLLSQPLPSERTRFILGPKQPAKNLNDCLITIAQGLAAPGGEPLESAVQIKFECRETVDVLSVEPFYSPSEGRGIAVTVSRPINAAALKRKLRILPPVGRIRVRKTDDETANVFHVTGGLETGKTYQAEIRGGEIEGDSYIFNKVSVPFTAKGPAADIRFEADRSVIELHSRQLVPVSVTNLSGVRCQLTRIPPLFAPEFADLTALALNDARRPRTSSAMRASDEVEEGIASAAVFAEQKMVEGVARLEEMRTLTAPAGSNTNLAWFTGDFAQSSEPFFANGAPDKVHRLSLPLSFRKEAAKGGAFLVQLLDPERPELKHATRLFQITDLSITYKFSATQLLVWVTSVETGKPVPDAAILLFTRDDKRLVLGATDRDGLLVATNGANFPAIDLSSGPAHLTVFPFNVADSAIVVAANGDDAAFMQLDTNRFRPYSVTQAPPGNVTLKSRNAHAFTERGIYKPGETVHFKATLRAYRDNAIVAPQGETVTIVVTDARDEKILDTDLVLNEYGTCSGSLKLKEFAPLGQYNLKVIHTPPAALPTAASLTASVWNWFFGDKEEKTTETKPGKTELVSVGFQVQQFEPPRHFVEIETETKSREIERVPGRRETEEYLEARIVGKYYTGGVLRHAKVRWTARMVTIEPFVEGYGGYHFGGSGNDSTLIESGESLLDKEGRLAVSLPVDRALMNGPYGIEISATVMDVDARPATQVTTWEPKTAIHVGMTRLPDLNERDEASLDVIAIGADGNRRDSGSVRLDILRKRWFYTQKRDEDGNIFYRWDQGWIRTLTTTQPMSGGKATFDLSFDDSGEYKFEAIYICDDGEFKCSQVAEVGYVYESGDDDEDSRTRRRSDSELVLSVDRAALKVDESARVDFSLPRAASHALITCERDRIFEWRVVPLNGRRGSFEMKFGADCRPNAFVTLTVPCGRTSMTTYRSQLDVGAPRIFYGVASVDVRNAVEGLKAIIAPDETEGKGDLRGRPGEPRRLTFRVTDEKGQGTTCEMAVCVVDEAVLALTGYVTPVLSRLLNFSLPLSVFTGDLRLSLLTQELFKLFATNPLTGGDMGSGALASDMALRKDFRPVAYWNPALYTDESGNAAIDFTLPDSTTAYRVYVVALSTGTAFCTAQRNMIVTKEFYLQPGMPRFLTAGDEAFFPLSACNKTDTAGKASLAVAETTNLTATLDAPEADLAPLTNTVVRTRLAAENGPGEGAITLSGRYGDYKDAIRLPLPIVSKHTVLTKTQQGSGTGKQEIGFDPPAGVAEMPAQERKNTLRATLTLTTTQLSRLTPGIKYLLQYPYGCIEQTSSGIIPLAAIRALVNQGLMPGITIAEVDKFLQSGVDRVLRMQTPGGLFAYWPGERTGSWWGTHYAMFALSLAKQVGFDVPQERLDKAVKAVRDLLLGKEQSGWRNYSMNDLAAVNLARNGALSADELTSLMTGMTNREFESQALLLWASAIVKNQSVDQLKKQLKKLTPTISDSYRDWTNSSVREVAATLLATLIIEGATKKADELAGMLLRSVSTEGRWNSTADTGWALFALAQYFEKKDVMSDRELPVRILHAGKPAIEATVGKTGAELVLDAEALLATPSIVLEGPEKALLHWAFRFEHPDPASRSEDLDKGFRVVKRVVNLTGSETIRVGDLLKIVVEFEDSFHRSNRWCDFQYVALEDPLPAGFIAINTALRTETPARSSSDDEEESDADDDNPEWYSAWEDGCYKLQPDHFEMRNDKVLAFKNRLWSNRFRFTYFARAVCEGTFWMRPTHVSLMYEPDYFGMTTGESIRIEPAAK